MRPGEAQQRVPLHATLHRWLTSSGPCVCASLLLAFPCAVDAAGEAKTIIPKATAACVLVAGGLTHAAAALCSPVQWMLRATAACVLVVVGLTHADVCPPLHAMQWMWQARLSPQSHRRLRACCRWPEHAAVCALLPCAVDVAGETKSFSPEEISAMILTKMKETAEVSLGCGRLTMT